MRGERLSRHIMKRISGGRLVNKVKRWRPTSETTAVDDITCFELVPPRKLCETGFKVCWEETKRNICWRPLCLYLVTLFVLGVHETINHSRVQHVTAPRTENLAVISSVLVVL
jgi:hypothetical protein